MAADTKVNISLCQDDVTFKVTIKVAVKSNIHPDLWGELETSADSPRLRYNVARMAEHIANHQCRAYGDMHNPQSVGRSAIEGLDDIMEAASKARLTRGQG